MNLINQCLKSIVINNSEYIAPSSNTQELEKHLKNNPFFFKFVQKVSFEDFFKCFTLKFNEQNIDTIQNVSKKIKYDTSEIQLEDILKKFSNAATDPEVIELLTKKFIRSLNL